MMKIENSKPPYKNCPIMVGGAVARPAASTEPDVKVSLHPALQITGSCHEHSCSMNFIMAVTVQQCQIGNRVVAVIAVPVVCFEVVF